MNHQKLAVLLDRIYKGREKAAKANQNLEAATTQPEEALGNDFFLNAEDIQKALDYDNRIKEAEINARAAEEEKEKAENELLIYLPPRILRLMHREHFALIGSYTSPDIYQHKTGPYAAYFLGEKLIIEPFTNIFELKNKLESLGLREAPE